MVEQTIAEVGSYIKNQDSITIITSAIDADDLTIAVDDVKALSKGVVETVSYTHLTLPTTPYV